METEEGVEGKLGNNGATDFFFADGDTFGDFLGDDLRGEVLGFLPVDLGI